ncbi:hypothetical protein [Alloalcanivorax marinus]|uniref:hypothetical protein n=1 Tax=Alloalcanivorax marinus TaxID=1177169 RepID=UPI001933FC4D|nr:hypothetical protein [Alloalcanivorax marinus]MBL7252556.1 hypothetical protein [Alloalcanivorax marinus]
MSEGFIELDNATLCYARSETPAVVDISLTVPSGGSVALETTTGSRFEVPLVFAGLVVVGAMGIVLYQAFEWLERRLTFWAVRG